MDDLAPRLRARILPALLTALGVALLTAGLLTYTVPVEAGPGPLGSPVVVTLPPTAEPPVTPGPSLGPSGGPSAAPTATFPADRVATRVVIAALGIDLPIVKPASDAAYPWCDVAMYIQELGQPGSGRATYIYAHAREGMFLPLLEASLVNNGAKMLGMLVEVYSSDNQLFLYEITEVRRHQVDLDDAVTATTEQLWLQTSEGPRGTRQKLQLVARFLSTGAADPVAAHPEAKPRVCG